MSVKPEKFQPYYDETGMKIEEGDLLRVYHFTLRQRKQRVYMYKVAIIIDGYMYGRDYFGDHKYGLWSVCDDNRIIHGTEIINKRDWENETIYRKEAKKLMQKINSTQVTN